MITANTLQGALERLGAAGGQCASLDRLASGASSALELAPTRNRLAVACWLATMTQESGYFRTTTEYGSGQRYAPYIGRTFEQITSESNYAAFGRWCASRDLVDDPDAFLKRPAMLSDLRWAWIGGIWYFNANRLWRYAAHGNLQAVSNGVNRGAACLVGYPSGWKTRLIAYRAYLVAIAPPPALPTTGEFDEATRRRLQLHVGVGVDGDFGQVSVRALQAWLGVLTDGSLTKDTIRALQARIGAVVDGEWGPHTSLTLQRYLNLHRR